jgi:hypothetical protein
MGIKEGEVVQAKVGNVLNKTMAENSPNLKKEIV